MQQSQNSGFSLRLSDGRCLVLARGVSLGEKELPGLHSIPPGGPVAIVNQHPNDPNICGLQNLSHLPWRVRLANGDSIEVKPGKNVRLAPGTRIRFGSIEGEVKDNSDAGLRQRTGEALARSQSNKGVLVFVLALLIIAGTAAGWWFGVEQPRRETERRQQAVAAAEKQKELDAENARAAAEKRQVEEEAAQAAVLENQRLAEEARKKEETSKGIAREEGVYPPTGFEMEKQTVEAPGGEFQLEQWSKYGAGEAGSTLYQTWLVPKSGNPVRLPEVKLPKDLYLGDDSGSVGFSSNFSFSPDKKYLFREQKLVHGINGAYLYRCDKGLDYQVIIPNMHETASNFFTSTTKYKLENGTGIVEFSAWESDDSLVLTLRGYSEGRKFAIEGWRCVFLPSTNRFTIHQDWVETNKQAIQRIDQVSR